ncbi:ankyrin repeat domain-containing protein [Sphingomonas sp.]|uniref:ankyrin repeat domain-containing protein n=1 Tax=Sphingomonas sp. TaxID=28214 RepID=UPI0025D2E624|nr:ankyrin repeat domain-containing protein [Sphingomonas sp.]MBV9527540.1 ankyrin repeat domain-containing protein [Sphingomonas sp.]
MKSLIFALAGLCLLPASPLLAQSTGYEGQNFVDAVRSHDGDKALQLFNSSGRGIVDARDAKGDTALVVAVSSSDEQFTAFLLQNGADPNLGGRGGDTPLIAAARVGYADAIGWLLGKGARVDGTNRMGETPLIVAVQQHEPRIARILLDAGANPDRTDSAAGYSARDYAARDAHSRDILQMIQQKMPKSGS